MGGVVDDFRGRADSYSREMGGAFDGWAALTALARWLVGWLARLDLNKIWSIAIVVIGSLSLES